MIVRLYPSERTRLEESVAAADPSGRVTRVRVEGLTLHVTVTSKASPPPHLALTQAVQRALPEFYDHRVTVLPAPPG